MGRKTLDAALKMGGGRFSGSSMPTYVFSRTLPAGKRDGVIFTSQSPSAVVRQLRKKKGKNIWLMGGGELCSSALRTCCARANPNI